MKLIVVTVLCSVMSMNMTYASNPTNITAEEEGTSDEKGFGFPSVLCYGGLMPDQIAEYECPTLTKCLIKSHKGKHPFKSCGMGCPKEGAFKEGDYECEIVNGWQRCCCEGPLCNQARLTKVNVLLPALIIVVTLCKIIL